MAVPTNQTSGAVGGDMRTSGTRKLSVFVVDDEELVADSLVQILNNSGFSASSLYSGFQAIDRAFTSPFDVLITDVVMAEMTGIEAAIEICKAIPNCKVLLMSGNPLTMDMLKDAHERGHDFDILAKPVHPSVIIDRLNAMSGLELKRQIDDNAVLKRKSIPFLFYSTHASKHIVNTVYETLNVQGFFRKQIDPADNLATIQSIVDYWTWCVHPNSL